jgi:hypothetical protein
VASTGRSTRTTTAPNHGGVDLDYTVNTFTDLVDFFVRAAGAGHGTAFIVDQ